MGMRPPFLDIRNKCPFSHRLNDLLTEIDSTGCFPNTQLHLCVVLKGAIFIWDGKGRKEILYPPPDKVENPYILCQRRHLLALISCFPKTSIHNRKVLQSACDSALDTLEPLKPPKVFLHVDKRLSFIVCETRRDYHDDLV